MNLPGDALNNRLVASVFLVVILAALLFSPSTSKIRGEGPDVNSRPKLIVVLVIDQFRYDYLVRFRPYFVKRGFNLLLSGANFVERRYPPRRTHRERCLLVRSKERTLCLEQLLYANPAPLGGRLQ